MVIEWLIKIDRGLIIAVQIDLEDLAFDLLVQAEITAVRQEQRLEVSESLMESVTHLLIPLVGSL